MLQNFKRIGSARWSVLQSLGKRSIRTNTPVTQFIFARSKIIKPLPQSLLCNIDISFRYSNSPDEPLDRVKFESICTETLHSLTEYFEELVESNSHLKNADVSYSDGVLTVHLGKQYGTYVINRQSPNLQIWLSSPSSGPKRYDFMKDTWVYKHDNTTLHALLKKELEEIAKKNCDDIRNCSYAKDKV